GYSLGNDIGVSKKAADEYIKKYLATYPKIAAYLENVKAQAKIDGYVTTMYGRRRYIPELQSSKKQLVSFGERVAMNTPIQGAAADIIKKAMVDTSKALEAEGMKASIILQIHDELIIECPSHEAEKAKTLLVHCMENAFQLKAPLIADAHIGKNWFDAKNEQ
ncbi:MAG: DNA polymerase A family protein, partial [Clostridia bacterium]